MDFATRVVGMPTRVEPLPALQLRAPSIVIPSALSIEQSHTWRRHVSIDWLRQSSTTSKLASSASSSVQEENKATSSLLNNTLGEDSVAQFDDLSRQWMCRTLATSTSSSSRTTLAAVDLPSSK
jgi:hypothetical protein